MASNYTIDVHGYMKGRVLYRTLLAFLGSARYVNIESIVTCRQNNRTSWCFGEFWYFLGGCFGCFSEVDRY